jgi:hypothetical protein
VAGWQGGARLLCSGIDGMLLPLLEAPPWCGSLVWLCLYHGGGGVAAPGLAAAASLLEVVGQVATSCGGSQDLTPSLDCEWRRHCR